MGYDVEVTWMDGRVKVYPKVFTTEEDGLLRVSTQQPDGDRLIVSIIPLENVREVQFP